MTAGSPTASAAWDDPWLTASCTSFCSRHILLAGPRSAWGDVDPCLFASLRLDWVAGTLGVCEAIAQSDAVMVWIALVLIGLGTAAHVASVFVIDDIIAWMK
jgi:hypothetical protein